MLTVIYNDVLSVFESLGKKSEEYSSLRKFWYLEEKENWYHKKFFTTCAKVGFSQFDVLKTCSVINDTHDTKSL